MKRYCYSVLVILAATNFGACKRLPNSNLEAITGTEGGVEKAFAILPIGAIGNHTPVRKVSFGLIECEGLPGFKPDQVIHKLEEYAAANLLSVNNGAICIPESFGPPNPNGKLDSCTHQNFVQVTSCDFVNRATPYSFTTIARASQTIAKLAPTGTAQLTREIMRAFVTAQAIYLSMRGPTFRGKPWGQSMFIHTYARMSGLPTDKLMSKQDAQDFVYNPCDTRQFEQLSPALKQVIQQYVPQPIISAKPKLAGFHCAPQSDNPEILHYGVGGSGSTIDPGLMVDISSYAAVRNTVYESISGDMTATGSTDATAGLALEGSFVQASSNNEVLAPLKEQKGTSPVVQDDTLAMQTTFSDGGNTANQTFGGTTTQYTFKNSIGGLSTYQSATGGKMNVGVYNGGEGSNPSVITQTVNSKGFYSPEGTNFGWRLNQKGSGPDATTHVWGFVAPDKDGKPIDLLKDKPPVYATMEDTALGAQRAIPARDQQRVLGYITDYAKSQNDPSKVVQYMNGYVSNDLNRDANNQLRPNSIGQSIGKPFNEEFIKAVKDKKEPSAPVSPTNSTVKNVVSLSEGRVSSEMLDPNVTAQAIDKIQADNNETIGKAFEKISVHNGQLNTPNGRLETSKGSIPLSNVAALDHSNRYVLNQVASVVNDWKMDYNVDISKPNSEAVTKDIQRRLQVHTARRSGWSNIVNSAMDFNKPIDAYKMNELIDEGKKTSREKLLALKEQKILDEKSYIKEIEAVNNDFRKLYSNFQTDAQVYNNSNNTKLAPLFADPYGNGMNFQGYIPIRP